jgi:hypothetical protein
MNTLIDKNSIKADKPRAVLNLPHAPIGSEDITIRRDMPVRAPKATVKSLAHATPVIRVKHVLAGLMLASMVGCGTTTGDRALSGAGIGAGAGAVVGAVTGIGPGTGAAIGAAAGAATGGLTKKKDVNLGQPIWR